MNEVKFLRKIEFPDSAVEALRQLERLCTNEASQSTQQLDILNSIAEEFIFLEVDRRGNKRKLPPVKELQVLEKLITYFSDSKNDPQNLGYVFLYLFMPGKKLGEVRLSILTKLVSVAVADLNSNILYFSGMWMQMSACSSEPALHVSKVIVKDYFLLMPSLVANLKTMPLLAPLFCSSFLTCLTILYQPLTTPPSQKLTELALEWLTIAPFLCSAPLKMAFSQKNSGPQIPLLGFIRWCTLIPLTTEENNQLYSRLHLAVLENMLGFSQIETPPHLKSLVISHSEIYSIIEDLKKYQNNENFQMSLDRFAQAVQIALSTNCLLGTAELFKNLSLLPQSRLLKIILEKCVTK